MIPHSRLLCFKECLINIKSVIQQCNPYNILMMSVFSFLYVNRPTHNLKTSACITIPDKASIESIFQNIDGSFLSQLVRLIVSLYSANKHIQELVLNNHTNLDVTVEINLVLCRLSCWQPIATLSDLIHSHIFQIMMFETAN